MKHTIISGAFELGRIERFITYYDDLSDQEIEKLSEEEKDDLFYQMEDHAHSIFQVFNLMWEAGTTRMLIGCLDTKMLRYIAKYNWNGDNKGYFYIKEELIKRGQNDDEMKEAFDRNLKPTDSIEIDPFADLPF